MIPNSFGEGKVWSSNFEGLEVKHFILEQALWIDVGDYEAEINIGTKPLGKKSTPESQALRIAIYDNHHGDMACRSLNFS